MRGKNDRKDKKSESDADIEVDAAVLICDYIGADANVGVDTCVLVHDVQDTDECAVGTHNCGALGPGYLCRNIQV